MNSDVDSFLDRRKRLVPVAVLVLVLSCSRLIAQVPDEVTGLVWCAGSNTCLQWAPTAMASSYQVVRGAQAELPALLTAEVDSCNRLVVPSTTASGLTEVPPPGELYWYLVSAGSVCGQGPAGNATPGARTVDTSGNCDSTCADSVVDGLETDTDCGGPTCAPCATNEHCLVPGDCASGVCQGGTCAPPSCVDGVQNGGETGVDCGGGTCAPCVDAQACCSGSDCQSGNCSAGTCIADTTPPTVSVTSPGNGTTASGMVTVLADAADNVGVSKVQFLLDGVNLGASDATAPYAASWNTTTSSNGPHTLSAIAYDVAANRTTSAPVVVTVSNTDPAALVGSWDPTMDWPVVAVHASLLRTGSVIVWDGYDGPNSPARLWDPQTNTMGTFAAPGDLFCSGHGFLSDGRLIVMGGHGGSEVGTPETNIFDPMTNSWTRVADMNSQRWYPSVFPLADATMVALSGQIVSGVWADTPEIYDPRTDVWTYMTGVDTSDTHDHEYALSYGLPDGRVFVLAASTDVVSVLDPVARSWTPAPSDPKLFLTSAVMYRLGKILASGGGDTTQSNAAQTSALVIDETSADPAWRSVSPMAFPRYQHNLLVLPDGTVFAVGGSTILDQNSQTGSLAGEIWNPATETWYTVASMRDPRMYHSTAVLLPDGRVLSAGGGREGTATNYLTAQVFRPPYLFKGARPTILSAPALANYISDITVTTQEAADISTVSLVSLTSVTHTLDMNQHFLELPFIRNAGYLTVTMPANGHMAPPGYYMLFIVNGQGVPSIAAMVRLPAPWEDTQAPTAPSNLSASTSPTSVTLTWTAATDNAAVARYNVHRSSAPGFTPSPSTLVGATTALGYLDPGVSGTLYYKVVAQDLAGNLSAPSNEVAVVLPVDTAPPTVSIAAPAIRSTVAGVVTVSAQASDNVGVIGVQFLLDAADLGSEDVSAPFSTSWDTTAVANGPHTLTARARDFAGNTTTSAPVTVTVDNLSAINFNDLTAVNAPLNGQYPTGVADWGTNAWWLSGPWGQFTTNSVSFNGPAQTSSTFSFLTPKRLVSLKAFNGGTVATTITLSCAGNPTVTAPVAVNQLLTITTGWTATCTTVTVGSSNAWNTNFDDLMYDGG